MEYSSKQLSGSEPWTNSLSNTICHPNFCVFISAKPAPTTEKHIIPQGILENSIKITGEPPTRMLPNFHAALNGFDWIKVSFFFFFSFVCFNYSFPFGYKWYH